MSSIPTPFIKSAGGKRRLVPFIREMMPASYGAYHEPFVGGGALFFALQPKRAYLSDNNEALINAYLGIRTDVTAVIERLESMTNDRGLFERVRRRNFKEGDIYQRAAEFIFMNKTCFNGLFRVNRDGQFNVPFGKYKNPTICDSAVLLNAAAALQNADVKHTTYNRAVDQIEAGDFVYSDPPYEPVSKGSFTSYTSGGFTQSDQERLRDVMLYVKKKGAFVLISNSDTPFIHQLYSGPNWSIRPIQAARSINSNGEGRGNVTELLIY